MLPLNDASTNQQGTHQAALMLLAADYTGGVAPATLFRGFPVVSVHPHPPNWPADGAAMWLAKAEITYKVPSTADLLVTCRVPTERIEQIRQRFVEGRSVLVPLEIQLECEEVLVATATLTYFAKRSSFLSPQAAGDRPNGLYEKNVLGCNRVVMRLGHARNSASWLSMVCSRSCRSVDTHVDCDLHHASGAWALPVGAVVKCVGLVGALKYIGKGLARNFEARTQIPIGSG